MLITLYITIPVGIKIYGKAIKSYLPRDIKFFFFLSNRFSTKGKKGKGVLKSIEITPSIVEENIVHTMQAGILLIIITHCYTDFYTES